ncbi:hypothetical protein C8F04DRAFT_1199190 [Mycena alexandri]|uniref:Uncharacterized protein n=1 Tax=Mycena alexandri TaxID=1745969 RepID=A0AAD6S0V1_9AGAR|nr:hypothetical protein C8F04DRAFT_1199190 [Mycena alexandri]
MSQGLLLDLLYVFVPFIVANTEKFRRRIKSNTKRLPFSTIYFPETSAHTWLHHAQEKVRTAKAAGFMQVLPQGWYPPPSRSKYQSVCGFMRNFVDLRWKKGVNTMTADGPGSGSKSNERSLLQIFGSTRDIFRITEVGTHHGAVLSTDMNGEAWLRLDSNERSLLQFSDYPTTLNAGMVPTTEPFYVPDCGLESNKWSLLQFLGPTIHDIECGDGTHHVAVLNTGLWGWYPPPSRSQVLCGVDHGSRVVHDFFTREQKSSTRMSSPCFNSDSIGKLSAEVVPTTEPLSVLLCG